MNKNKTKYEIVNLKRIKIMELLVKGISRNKESIDFMGEIEEEFVKYIKLKYNKDANSKWDSIIVKEWGSLFKDAFPETMEELNKKILRISK